MITKEQADKVPQWVWNSIEESLDKIIYDETGKVYNENTEKWEHKNDTYSRKQ